MKSIIYLMLFEGQSLMKYGNNYFDQNVVNSHRLIVVSFFFPPSWSSIDTGKNFFSQLLVQYTSVVDSPPDEMCSICMWSLQEPSGYSEDEEEAAGSTSRTAGKRLGGPTRISTSQGHHMHVIGLELNIKRSTAQYMGPIGIPAVFLKKTKDVNSKTDNFIIETRPR